MTQYIKKSEIVAEIKRRIKECDKLADAAADNNLSNTQQANELLIRQYTSLLHFLDTLEVKEVNLEKELDEWIKYGPHTNYPWCTIPDAIRITAEHFYELGLKAKGE